MKSGGWWICPSRNLVCIDDALMENMDCSLVADNIYLVQWFGDNGELIYNHDASIPVHQPITDMSPYIPIFNEWILQAESNPPDPSPPLQLYQARFVKSQMVDFLFASKRQMPVSYLGHIWDGSDNATAAMSDEIAAVSGTDAINAAVGNLAASTQEAFDNLTAQTNSGFSDLSSDTNEAISGGSESVNSALADTVDNVNTAISQSIDSVNATTATYAGQLADANHTGVLLQGLNTTGSPGSAPYSHTDAINTLVAHAGNPSYIVYQTATISFPQPPMGAATAHAATPASVTPGTVSAPTLTSPSVAATPASGPPITWPPLDGPPVTMTYVEFTTLLSMLTSRRRTLQITRTQHKNNIATLPTIDAVAAYDITSGW